MSETKGSTTAPRFFQRLGTRLFFSHFTAIFLALGIVSFALLSLMRGYFLEALTESLYVQAELITRSMIPGASTGYEAENLPAAFNTMQEQQLGQLNVQVENLGALQEALLANDQLAALEEASFQINSTLLTGTYLFNTEGEPISAPDGDLENNQTLEAVLSSALQGSHQRSQIAHRDGTALITASPILIQGQVSGALVLMHPLQDLEEVLANMWLRIGLAALASLVISGILSLYLARSLQKPVQSLKGAADQLVQGNFDHPISIDRSDELGELSRSFILMRDRLQETEQLRTQFLGDIAHELRTPLTAIKSLIETLRDGAVEDDRVRDRFLASIERETDRLVRLTRDVLLLTRNDLQGPRLDRRVMDLAGLVEELCQSFEAHAAQRGVELACTLPPKAVVATIDRDRIEQVLINLLDNALSYAPPDSLITISLREAEASRLEEIYRLPPTVRDSLTKDDSRWGCVEIRDQGPGIPQAELERVYERFYRIGKARDRSSGGSGLGIPIAKALVEAHGGLFWLESPAAQDSERQPGTIACFALPLSR